MQENTRSMRLIAHDFGYHFYIGMKNGKSVYNVIPEDQYPNHNPPIAGYFSSAYICSIKNVPNLLVRP